MRDISENMNTVNSFDWGACEFVSNKTESLSKEIRTPFMVRLSSMPGPVSRTFTKIIPCINNNNNNNQLIKRQYYQRYSVLITN